MQKSLIQCKFLEKCKRIDCWYGHPERQSGAKPIFLQNQNNHQCKRNGNSSDIKSSKGRKCRYGAQCQRADCRYEHTGHIDPSNSSSKNEKSQEQYLKVDLEGIEKVQQPVAIQTVLIKSETSEKPKEITEEFQFLTDMEIQEEARKHEEMGSKHENISSGEFGMNLPSVIFHQNVDKPSEIPVAKNAQQKSNLKQRFPQKQYFNQPSPQMVMPQKSIPNQEQMSSDAYKQQHQAFHPDKQRQNYGVRPFQGFHSHGQCHKNRNRHQNHHNGCLNPKKQSYEQKQGKDWNQISSQKQGGLGLHCRIFRGQGRHHGGNGGFWKNRKQEQRKRQISNSESQCSYQDSSPSQSKEFGILKEEKESFSYNDVSGLRKEQEKFKQLPGLRKANQALSYFFDLNIVRIGQRLKAFEKIVERQLTADQIQKLIEFLTQLTNQGYRQYFGMAKLTKITINKEFDYQKITKKLNQEINTILKKCKKQQQLIDKFPDPLQVQFLQVQGLLDLDISNTIFLIDGNNILATNGKFRKYFESKDQTQKAEAQIRLNWLVGEILKGFLFFDDYFDAEIRVWLQNTFMEADQEKYLTRKYSQIEVIYPRKDDNSRATADDRIREKLLEIHDESPKNGKQGQPTIILVSADRILTQECLQINPQIKKTSGKQFFKYCKKVIKNKYYNQKEKNGIIKKIFTYRF